MDHWAHIPLRCLSLTHNDRNTGQQDQPELKHEEDRQQEVVDLGVALGVPDAVAQMYAP